MTSTRRSQWSGHARFGAERRKQILCSPKRGQSCAEDLVFAESSRPTAAGTFLKQDRSRSEGISTQRIQAVVGFLEGRINLQSFLKCRSGLAYLACGLV